MADYFSEYSSFVGAKGLPSPADTPYETPSFIRSKRSSRATAGSSRDQSASPPPLPPATADVPDSARDGRYSALDPRRFTPTLHASLVSEILSLRRELDSKNNLVENLETSLSTAKADNDALNGQLSEHVKSVRKAQSQVQLVEKGTGEALEGLVRERDVAQQAADDLRAKLDAATKKTRQQDDDLLRTQEIWESEKGSWDNERRQLERRIHVTESRLRTFVDEMAAQQAAVDAQSVHLEETGDESTLKDSGIGNESDTASIQSSTPKKHRRNQSSLSFRTRSVLGHLISTRAATGTPEPQARPNGNSLADELGIDEEEEYDVDDSDHADDELDYAELRRRTVESRNGSVFSDIDSKARRMLGLAPDRPESPSAAPRPPLDVTDAAKQPSDSAVAVISPVAAVDDQPPEPAAKVEYVDSGYQPSPPPSPKSKGTSTEHAPIPTIAEPAAASDDEEPVEAIDVGAVPRSFEVAPKPAASPVSPPDAPAVDGVRSSADEPPSLPAPAYSNASVQTDLPEPEEVKTTTHVKRDSLSPPVLVPSIAIHPPSSRPSSPRAYVLPPGTKNASAQANLPWPSRDASVQTEEIRIDTRMRRLKSDLLLSHANQSHHQRQQHPLLPSPAFQEHQAPKRAAPGGAAPAPVSTKFPPLPSLPSPPVQSPTDSSPDMTREPWKNHKDPRNMPLRAIPLPRPVLAPAQDKTDGSNDGPLNRSSHYGVTRPLQTSSQLLDIDRDSDYSDYEDPVSDVDLKDITGSVPGFSKAPHGRFGLSEPPQMVPEDKEISPERRPNTSESYGAAPAPSVASSRANSQRAQGRPPAKLGSFRDVRSRSPSFGSMASSSFSAQSSLPPFPIPRRSSSKHPPKTHSEGSQSPTPHGGSRRSSHSHARQNSLRKVQSAAAIRQSARSRFSPQKIRRRRRSPNLTPVQSMAFDTPGGTKFPIPELPTPLQESSGFDLIKGSADFTKPPSTAGASEAQSSSETNLVDAIAATMVGEWMWKYIRKRKSFGIGEETSELPGENINGVSISAHGTRHKRWVWLSPYERTIMWDTKQPTTGPALLGKKGRKLAIQSVLDVPDDTPAPKSADLDAPFNRSILILTPARALKFATISPERHNIWMTALAFLAQSGRLPAQLPQTRSPAAPPPIPVSEMPSTKPRSPSFGRSTIRDSVRLTKGRRPSLPQTSSQAAGENTGDQSHEDQGADFPAVPRLYIGTTKHRRRRSNTSPRLPAPLNGLRSLSSTAIPSSASSRLLPTSTAGSSFRADLRSSSSKSGSVASPDRPNFFEAVGEVRMEAFVDPNVRDGVLYVPAPPPQPPPPPPTGAAAAAGGHRRRRRDSNLSQTTIDKRRAGYVFDEDGMDPFKGF